jgi:hypothetical protein
LFGWIVAITFLFALLIALLSKEAR